MEVFSTRNRNSTGAPSCIDDLRAILEAAFSTPDASPLPSYDDAILDFPPDYACDEYASAHIDTQAGPAPARHRSTKKPSSLFQDPLMNIPVDFKDTSRFREAKKKKPAKKAAPVADPWADPTPEKDSGAGQEEKDASGGGADGGDGGGDNGGGGDGAGEGGGGGGGGDDPGGNDDKGGGDEDVDQGSNKKKKKKKKKQEEEEEKKKQEEEEEKKRLEEEEEKKRLEEEEEKKRLEEEEEKKRLEEEAKAKENAGGDLSWADDTNADNSWGGLWNSYHIQKEEEEGQGQWSGIPAWIEPIVPDTNISTVGWCYRASPS